MPLIEQDAGGNEAQGRKPCTGHGGHRLAAPRREVNEPPKFGEFPRQERGLPIRPQIGCGPPFEDLSVRPIGIVGAEKRRGPLHAGAIRCGRASAAYYF